MTTEEHNEQLVLLVSEADAVIAGYNTAIGKAKTEAVKQLLTEQKDMATQDFRQDLEALRNEFRGVSHDSGIAGGIGSIGTVGTSDG